MKALHVEIFETVRQAASKVWNDVQAELNRPDANGKTPVDRLLDKVQDVVENGKQILTPESLKIALSYREFSRESLSFQDLLTIIKQNYSLVPGMSVCVLKTAPVAEEANPFYAFDIVACSESKEILFRPTCPWCHLVVAVPDPEFLKQFGEKSMLVLK